MARKAENYVVGVLYPYKDRTEIKYVTSIEEKYARWEDEKEAMIFSKNYAKDLAFGLSVNGFPAIPMIKPDYITLKNPEKKEDDE